MVDLNLTKLSVLLRAAEAYASNDVSGICENALMLYPDSRYPFVLSADYSLPLHLFSPRLAAMLTRNEDELDAVGMWNLISARENIIRMVSATELKRTAAESLGKQLEDRYPDDKFYVKRKQMIGYMVKVVMECFGYLVHSSRTQVDTFREGADPEKRKSNYFKTATRYTAMRIEDRDALLIQIPDEKIRAAFVSITDLIHKGETAFQALYQIDELSYWDSL
ncbi:MAG: hypothetical protein CVU48_05905 [Candidatus Cloacimonetes bacterium HGW-Cloacimonetes-1]|jgi:hypothetical protein|nr:MAG: hypothetical protein CVU48_05905 [Candidatus Cloacimonetes bacterium HGW-Cloacimonetes-1]